MDVSPGEFPGGREGKMNSEMCKCGHDQEQHHAESGCLVAAFGPPRQGFQPLEFCPCDKFVTNPR
jgi:hypothetical protein